MTLTQIGKAMGKDPRDAVMDLVIADRGESSVITAIMDEDDVRTALKHPLVGVGTDSGAQAEDGRLSESKSHPRAWGSFPRILGHYVRDEHLLTLEEAIRKMTSKAADARAPGRSRHAAPGHDGRHHRLRSRDDSRRRRPSTIRSTTRSACRHVFVNGRRVVADGAITAERPGRPLRGPGVHRSSRLSALDCQCRLTLTADALS